MDLFEKANWTVLIAVIALILSQLPPIRQMLKRKKLRMAVADMAQFSHIFGNTNMSLWVDQENIGGKTITIRRISCFLERGGHVQSLTARTYWLTESFSRERAIELPLAEIPLAPGERWSGFLHLWDTHAWGKAIESRVKSNIINVRDNIAKKAAERDKKMAAVPVAERSLVEADPQFVQETLDIVKSLRKLEEGEYQLLVAAFENPNGPPLKILGFSLALFESDLRDIFEDVDDYKYGFGVGLPSRKAKYVQVQIRLKNDKESEELFNSIKV